MNTKAMIANLLGLKLSQLSVRTPTKGSCKGELTIYIHADVDQSSAREAVRNILPPSTPFFLQVF